MKDAWTLKIGKSTKVLPKVLEDVGEIDIFLHDSEHTYENMMAEYDLHDHTSDMVDYYPTILIEMKVS